MGLSTSSKLDLLPAEIHIPQPESDNPAELAMIARLRDDGPALLDAYLAKETKNGVTFIARDAAKRLFTEYKQDPVKNNRYSDRAASSLADAVRRTILSHEPVHPRNQVLIVTGAPASGKSAAARPVASQKIEIVHETIFTSLDRARTIIRDAIDAARFPTISLVYTNDPLTNVHRMIGRARRIGRTVPLAYMAEAYVNVPKAVRLLKWEFGSDISLLVTDNSGEPGYAEKHNYIERAVETTGRYTVSDCLRRMDHELTRIDHEDPIPDDILREANIR
jgi:hypothetical protein